MAGTTRLELANQLIEGQPAFHFAFIPMVHLSFALSAPKARNMIARGKRERSEARRPWSITPQSAEGLKGRNNSRRITPFQGSTLLVYAIQGRRA